MLECLQSLVAASTSEVARAMELNAGTTQRALVALEARGLVRSRFGKRKRFGGGTKIRQWTSTTSGQFIDVAGVAWDT